MNFMEKNMNVLLFPLSGKWKKLQRIAIFIMVILLMIGGNSFATGNSGATVTKSTADAYQQKTISGKVVDEQGAPLPGVTVVVKGTTVGMITNIDGEYNLQVPDDAKVLVFSFVGMKAQEAVIGSQTTINITMQTESIGLDEVIAVGYATQKKANIVGSVTSVNGEKIESIPSADVSNALSGRMPGAVIIQPTGEPGQNEAVIKVRGRTYIRRPNDAARIELYLLHWL